MRVVEIIRGLILEDLLKKVLNSYGTVLYVERALDEYTVYYTPESYPTAPRGKIIK